MPTTNQLVRKGRRKKKRRKRQTTSHLDGQPHMRGVVLRAHTMNPRKPNSANRKIARVRLNNGKEVSCYFPGEHGFVREHDTVLVEPGRSPDLPGFKYRIVRGVYDAPPLDSKRRDPKKKKR